MIFVTVGTQLPFDRLVGAVDDWAASRKRRDVFAQIGEGGRAPRHLAWTHFLDAGEFQKRCAQARLVVAHLGMGSIITAMELGKPILVMPRRADLNEHRNDHQLASARQFAAQGRVNVAYDEAELIEKLDRLVELESARPSAATTSPELLSAVRSFVLGHH